MSADRLAQSLAALSATQLRDILEELVPAINAGETEKYFSVLRDWSLDEESLAADAEADEVDVSGYSYRLPDDFDDGHDVAGEFDWITAHLGDDEWTRYFELRGEIQRNYAGRGEMFQVPDDCLIATGVAKLVEAGLLLRREDAE
jgi:hypothetical protein